MEKLIPGAMASSITAMNNCINEEAFAHDLQIAEVRPLDSEQIQFPLSFVSTLLKGFIGDLDLLDVIEYLRTYKVGLPELSDAEVKILPDHQGDQNLEERLVFTAKGILRLLGVLEVYHAHNMLPIVNNLNDDQEG